MRIKNEYRETVYWRVFNGDDTIYTVGLAQGITKPGKSDGWRDNSFEDIKVETKAGDILFSEAVLARAGRKFKLADDLVITSLGSLETAQVQFLGDWGQERIKCLDSQFIDARSSNGSVERTLTSRVSTTFTNTEVSESSSPHEQTWTAGGKFYGTLGKKDVSNVNANISLQFQKEFALDRGSATYFGERTSFSVVRSAELDRLTPSAYNSPERLPEKYHEKWNEARNLKATVQGA